MNLIREYQEQDSAQVEACFIELQEFERQIEPRRVEGVLVAKKYLKHMFKRCSETEGKVFVLEVDDRIAGFVSVWGRVRTNGLVNVESEIAYISDLVVLADYRGQGFGRLLLERAEAYALSLGATLLSLGVLAENAVARRLYNDFGFEEKQVEMFKPLRAVERRKDEPQRGTEGAKRRGRKSKPEE